MTWADRIINAVSPEAEICRLTDSELSELVEELADRGAVNEIWIYLHGRVMTECVRRFLRSADSRNLNPSCRS